MIHLNSKTKESFSAAAKKPEEIPVKFFEKHPIYMIIIGVIGISFSAIIVKYSDAPSLITALYRLAITVLLMTPVVLGSSSFRQELLSVSPKTVCLCAFSGIFLAAHFVIWFESLFYTSVASSTVIVCTESIWVALGYCLFLHGHMKLKAIAGIGIAFFGSLLIALSDYGSGSNLLLGDLLSLIAALMVAGYTLLGRVVRNQTSTTIYTYIVYIFCTLTLFLASFCTKTPIWGYGYSSLASGFGLAVCSTLLGHSIFSWCLKYFSPAFVSASKLCEPVVAAVLAMFLFGEIPTLLQVIGGLVILTGVIYYSKVEQNS